MFNQRLWFHSLWNVSLLGLFCVPCPYSDVKKKKKYTYYVSTMCGWRDEVKDGREVIDLASAPMPWQRRSDGGIEGMKEEVHNAAAPTTLLKAC